jgi:TonB family protein
MKIMPRLLLAIVGLLVSVSSLLGQAASPVAQPPPPKAIYTPAPVYRPEWAKQRLTGKGIVLVTIDSQTGKVTGARMETSTGNQQLDGAALAAYSQWRFQPGSVSQVKMPIEFATRAGSQPAKRTLPQPILLVILLVIAGAAIGLLKKRRA